MTIVLGANQYGKAENRLVRVYRDTPRHEIRDLNVSSSLRGDFRDAHITGDQAAILPTDTQKNTVFAFAKEKGVTSIEEFALTLGDHFIGQTPKATGIEIEEYAWDRISIDGTPHDHAFVRNGGETRTTVVTVEGRGARPPGLGRLRSAGSRRGQDHGLGVLGVPQGQVHDPAGDHGPHPGHLPDRPLAL